MGTHTLLVGVPMGFTTLERKLATFTNVQDTHTLQPRISTSMRFITQTVNRLTRSFVHVLIVNIICDRKKGSKKKENKFFQ